MWRFEAGLLCCLCVVTVLLPLSTLAGSDSKYGHNCDSESVENQCGFHERCQQIDAKTNVTKCTCIKPFEYNNVEKRCESVTTTEPPITTPTAESMSSNSQGGSSVAAILLIPTCLVIIGALGYFGARRYKWLQRFRQFRQNRYGTVLVTRDDTDEDDPPIA